MPLHNHGTWLTKTTRNIYLSQDFFSFLNHAKLWALKLMLHKTNACVCNMDRRQTWVLIPEKQLNSPFTNVEAQDLLTLRQETSGRRLESRPARHPRKMGTQISVHTRLNWAQILHIRGCPHITSAARGLSGLRLSEFAQISEFFNIYITDICQTSESFAKSVKLK